MRLHHLPLLRSPKTGQPLQLTDQIMDGDRVRSGRLTDGENSWPITNYIPRFVPESEYWDSFSFQWAKHPRLLSERFSGYTVYKTRFENLGWPADLSGEVIIEAGCGSGAFTKYALATGATVISFDVSKSVDHSLKDNDHPNLLIVQASIYEMPFVKADRIYCLGVIQHTPDPKASLKALADQVKPRGPVCTDIYAKLPWDYFGPYNLLRSKYAARKWSVNIDKEKLHGLITTYVKVMWWPCMLLQKFGTRAKQLSAALLIDDYKNRMKGMRGDQLQEFAILDLFDMLSPTYDLPATVEEYRAWHDELGLQVHHLDYGYNGIEARATAPA